jgi:SSS family solute:Na+ symporter
MGFSAIDYIVLFAYLAGITIFGVLFRKSQKTVKDYFVGAKNINWIVISLSIVATETSTLTLIGVPAIAYANYALPEQGGNYTYLQVVIGYVIARFIISLLFIPAYFRGEMLTAYKLLENRFGTGTKNFAASMFLVMRALAEGVRIFAASIVLSAVLGTSLPSFPNLTYWSIAIVGVLTLIYTFEGGIAAVIWTDLIQFIIYVGGSLVAAYMLLTLVPGGWNEIYAQGAAGGKFQTFSFQWSYNLPFTFWAGLFGGTFMTMASHGTDQLLVQRLLTCKNQRDSQKALILSGFVVLLQFALFLTIGVMLYSYYAHVPIDPTMSAAQCLKEVPATCDRIFPQFIVAQLPHGISGLVIAAIFAAAMSNLSGSLNSLASTTVLDFYKPLIDPNASDESLLRLSRWLTAIWGVVLIILAFLVAQGIQSVLFAGLTIASLVYGPMLGAFLLGVLTKRANQTGVIAGMLASIIVMLTLKSADLLGYNLPFHDLAWTWFVLVGTTICLVVGSTVSVLFAGSDVVEKPADAVAE